MTLVGLVIIGLVVVALLVVGAVAGWQLALFDSQSDALAKGLAAEQRMDAITRAAVRSMRDAVRKHDA